MTDKFKTSMDRIVESLEGDTPSTDIYADSIQRIADALENGSGGGIVFIDIDTETHALNASYNRLKSIVDGGAMPCVVVKTSQSVQIGYLFKLFESSATSYRAEFMNISGQSATPTIYKWPYEATDPDANMDEAEV